MIKRWRLDPDQQSSPLIGYSLRSNCRVIVVVGGFAKTLAQDTMTSEAQRHERRLST